MTQPRLTVGRRLAALAFVVLVGVAGEAAAQTPVPAADRAALADTARFRTVRTVAEIPPAVRNVAGDYKGRLADPGGEWAPTDDISPTDTRAHRRLIWAAGGPGHWVVYFEQGGIARTNRVAIVRLGGAAPEVVWTGYAPVLADYPAFVRAIDAGTLRGDRR